MQDRSHNSSLTRRHPEFLAGNVTTGFIEQHSNELFNFEGHQYEGSSKLLMYLADMVRVLLYSYTHSYCITFFFPIEGNEQHSDELSFLIFVCMEVGSCSCVSVLCALPAAF